MRVLVPVTLEIVCAGARAEVSMDLEMEAQVLSYTPPEPAGREHAPVPAEWEIEIRLCDDLKVEDIVVLEAGQDGSSRPPCCAGSMAYSTSISVST
ncbi:MAG: hypothetical protein GY772_04980, partial [bacterium]|nr:hypothetical protein [bacterium]